MSQFQRLAKYLWKKIQGLLLGKRMANFERQEVELGIKESFLKNQNLAYLKSLRSSQRLSKSLTIRPHILSPS
jgi:hypothetical protein